VACDTENIVINFYYAADSLGGGKDGDESDSIPDKYQKKVIFEVINGKWSDDTSDDISVYVTLVTDGKWDINGSAELIAPEGMKAEEGFEGGEWIVLPPSSVSGTDEVKYTFVFVEKTSEPEDPDIPENPEGPDTPDNPEKPDNPDGPVDPDNPDTPNSPGGNGGINSDRKHNIVFGKTDGIGWYNVSMDGGETYQIVFGNSTLEVAQGTELIINVGDLTGDTFLFYVNEIPTKADENGNLVVTVKGYMLIRALGFKSDAADTIEEKLSFFEKLIKAIKEFFDMLFGWMK